MKSLIRKVAKNQRNASGHALRVSLEFPLSTVEGIAELAWNFGLDQVRQQSERFLPAEIASLGRNSTGYAFLQDVQLSPAGCFVQRYRCLHFPGQVRVVKFACVAYAFAWHQLEIFPAE
jgi:hypothetical protein